MLDCTSKRLKLLDVGFFLLWLVSGTDEERNMTKTLKKPALTQTTEGYASRSSIPGIGYLFDRELNIGDRLLWLLVVLAFLGIAAALSWNFWSQWQDQQVSAT